MVVLGDKRSTFLKSNVDKYNGRGGRVDVGFWGPTPNRRFPEITGEDNLTVFSYSGRVKSPNGGGSGEEPICDSFRSSGMDLL